MDDAQTLLSVSYIILLILEWHFCPPPPAPASKRQGGQLPLLPPSSGVPAFILLHSASNILKSNNGNNRVGPGNNAHVIHRDHILATRGPLLVNWALNTIVQIASFYRSIYLC